MQVLYTLKQPFPGFLLSQAPEKDMAVFKMLPAAPACSKTSQEIRSKVLYKFNYNNVAILIPLSVHSNLIVVLTLFILGPFQNFLHPSQNTRVAFGRKRWDMATMTLSAKLSILNGCQKSCKASWCVPTAL